ncbi:MAG: DUF2225 domain-containing protein [candidate division Zixibacteria bacterium]|nr:DUF2225 domain-containing protein [candidate division Zixibacteria bacterium]
MKSAFFNTIVECPVCRNEHSFETIRVGAYVESGRDTDFCPTGVKWRFAELQGYNPLVYFVATCPTCLYSREFNNSFRNWKKDNTFRTYRVKKIREKHLQELSDDNSMLKRVSGAIDMENAPNESAVMKLLLAIFDESLSEHVSALDLARWYLRIGWIYREMDGGADGSSNILGQTVAKAGASLGNSLRTFNAWKDSSDVYTDTLKKAMKSLDVVSHISRLVEMNESLLKLQMSAEEILHDQGGVIKAMGDDQCGGSQLTSNTSIGGHNSLFEFIMSLKHEWQDAPANEREALLTAIHYYKLAFEGGKEVSKGNQQTQVCYLIAELSRRVGLYDQAREYFHGAIKSGQQLIHEMRGDKSRTALARKILELAMEQNQLTREMVAELAVE